MNFEKPNTPEEETRSPRLRELIKLSLTETFASSVVQVKNNAIETGLSLSAQAGLIFMFLNRNISDLQTYIDLPGTDEVAFIDKRLVALILSHALVKSGSKLREYLSSHGQHQPTIEPAV